MNILGIILLFAALGFFIFVYRVEKERDRLKYILPLITAFGVMGFALIFRENIVEFPIPGVGTIKTVAHQTLDNAKFVDEISKTVLAQSGTIGLVAKQANEMQPEIPRIAGEIKKFEMFLNDMRDTLQKEYQIVQKEYQTVSEEIEPLKLQSILPLFGDKALSHDDREAFDQIIRIAQTAPEDSALKKSAIDEVRRFIYQVGGSWIAGEFISTSLLGKSDSGLLKDDTQIPTDRLIVSLSDPDFKVRVRAAMLLGNRTEKGVPDSLLQVARTDKHLRAAYYTIVSFGYITRRMNRPIAAGYEPISPEQLIEMFDIDKLEQWWQAHSAEINEKLK